MNGQNSKPLIVAVSGGIDSMVLLHMLATKDESLIVAHVDHGIREDSSEDTELVRQIADSYGLTFVTTELQLGDGASEELARMKRYEWLERVMSDYDAKAIATAHHQDDVLETIAINVTRGTGWRGLCSLRSTETRYRPLLGTSKAEIAAYALEHQILWREDSTNQTSKYLRNRIRIKLNTLPIAHGKQLLRLYKDQCHLRGEIEPLLAEYISLNELPKRVIVDAPKTVATEILRTWLPQPLERRRLSDLCDFIKTAKRGDLWSLNATEFVRANRDTVIVQSSRD